MRVQRSTIFLSVALAVTLTICLTVTSTKQVSAGVAFPQNCSVATGGGRVDSRCFNDGYFSGTPSFARPFDYRGPNPPYGGDTRCGATLPGSGVNCNVELPLFNLATETTDIDGNPLPAAEQCNPSPDPNCTYYDRIDYGGGISVQSQKWSFDPVPNCTTGSTVPSGPGCTHNQDYANDFISQMHNFLFAWHQTIYYPGGVFQGNPVSCMVQNGGDTVDNLKNPEKWTGDPYTGTPPTLCGAFRSNVLGRAMIIDTMLGTKYCKPQGTAAWPATLAPYTVDSPFYTSYENQIDKLVQCALANFDVWKGLVHQYDAAGQVNWDQSAFAPLGHTNSTGMNWGTDDEFFAFPKDERLNEIAFSNSPGGPPIYEINRSCGNIVGAVTPLTPISNTYHFHPTAIQPVLTPAGIGATSVHFHTVVNTYGTILPVQPLDFREKFYIKHLVGGNTSLNVTNQQGGPNYVFANPINDDNDTIGPLPALKAGDQVCTDISINPSAGSMDANGNVDPHGITAGLDDTGEICTPVGFYPYYRVFGGDVVAGSGFEASACAATQNANIIGWNSESNPFTGAGTQFAAEAIQNQGGSDSLSYDFATAQNVPGSGSGLMFANTNPPAVGLNSGAYVFGGDLNAKVCAPTTFAGAVSIPGPKTLSQILSAIGHPGGGNSYKDNKTVVITSGDVEIDTNLQYNPANWGGDPTKIPSFILVVQKGNIYIDKGVTEIDGTYEALKNGASGGTIYTCTNGATSALPSYSDCNSQLFIYGSLLAQSIKFRRTSGTSSQSTSTETSSNSHAGEVFVYSPEQWLNSLTPGISKKYDSINDLPPIL